MPIASFDMPISHLKGVGPQVAKRLKKLGLLKIEDLLFHLPSRYQDRSHVTLISACRSETECLIEAVVESCELKSGKKRMLVCVVRDDSSAMILRFFHFSRSLQEKLSVGTRLRCFGEVRQGYDWLEMVHPEYQNIDALNPIAVETQLTPIYPTTEGLHQGALRKLFAQAVLYDFKDYLPDTLLPQQLPDLKSAILSLHQPCAETASIENILERRDPASQRLAFEELLARHLSQRLVRGLQKQHAAPCLDNAGLIRDRFLKQLTFQLTAAQIRVNAELSHDLSQNNPMQRLVQGDVGSGKTVVAAIAAAQALESGYQVALMAPTELLAEQHLHTFQTWFNPLDIHCEWLAGSLTPKQRAAAIERIASGQSQLVIGTHALFQDAVQFFKLGLMIIDEQHRFGVDQRLALRDKGKIDNQVPHQLMMTATPIPRTLAMTAYADLDVSVIDELPPNRTPITTVALPNTRRDEVIARVAHACEQHRQAYWVCSLIEESDTLQAEAAEDTAKMLQSLLPHLRIGLAHGRMKSKQKEAVMHAFKAGELDLLVATTVIEVGVDVPNASLMIIENAERLGLAQLHQLRGRVGRGTIDSYCVLMYQAPLSYTGQSRLSILRETQDGFLIAERDLQLRGAGDLLGTRQTGLQHMKIADLQRDQDLLEYVPAAAQILLEYHQDKVYPLVQRWVTDSLTYGDVC